VQIGLGHFPQSRNTNLFTPSGRAVQGYEISTIHPEMEV